MKIDIDPQLLIEEDFCNPWVLPENAITLVMYSHDFFKLYDSRDIAPDNKKSSDAMFACALLLRSVEGDLQSRDMLKHYLVRNNI